MAGKPARAVAILSFHRVYRACLAAEDEGWRNLLRQFLPITEHLARQYFSDVWPDPTTAAGALFSRLRANDAERLRAYTGSAEKEFLMFLRDEFFALGRDKRDGQMPLEMSHEQFAQLLNDFLPIPREAVVMLAKGYPPEKLGVVLHMEDSTAKSVLEKANQKLEAMGVSRRLPANLDRLLWELEKRDPGQDCVPVRTFVRILDGQITWQEKEAADRHTAACLHCFERFVTFQELHWFFLDYSQADPRRVENAAAKMGLASAEPAKKSSIFDRVFRPFRGQNLSA